MAIVCCVCGKKQSGWIMDYPLSPELSEHRLCMECGEKYQKIQKAEKAEDVAEEIAYIKEKLCQGNANIEAENFLALLFEEENIGKTAGDIEDEIKGKRDEVINQILVTSSHNFEGYKITKYCDYISAEIVLGLGAFKALLASVSSVTGTESSAFGEKINEAKSKVLYEIRKNAYCIGANAIIAIDIDFSTIIDSMVIIIASGTAVVIEKI